MKNRTARLKDNDTLVNQVTWVRFILDLLPLSFKTYASVCACVYADRGASFEHKSTKRPEEPAVLLQYTPAFPLRQSLP